MLQELFIEASKKLEALSAENAALRSAQGDHRNTSVFSTERGNLYSPNTSRKISRGSGSASDNVRGSPMSSNQQPSSRSPLSAQASPRMSAAPFSSSSTQMSSAAAKIFNLTPPPPPQATQDHTRLHPHQQQHDDHAVLFGEGRNHLKIVQDRNKALVMGGIMKALQDLKRVNKEGGLNPTSEGHKMSKHYEDVDGVTKEDLAQAAASIISLIEMINDRLSTERDSTDSLNLSSLRKCIHMGLFGGLGLKLQDVDIVFSSIGVKQVSLYGVAYVLVKLSSRCSKVDNKCGTRLIDALRETSTAFVAETSKSKSTPSKGLTPALDLSKMSTDDLSSLKRLLEAQTSALMAIFSAYKPDNPVQHQRRGNRVEDGEVTSVDAVIRFALDFGIIPNVISCS